MDSTRLNYVVSFVHSFLGVASSAIRIPLMFFQSTRLYAFYALIPIVTVWFSYAYYLTYKDNKTSRDIDALLNPLEVFNKPI